MTKLNDTKPINTADRYCIIGAGPAGLAAGVAFQKFNIPFDIVDQGHDVGGMWDISRTETPVYCSAHFISSKTLSAFDDFPMPTSYPNYPHHKQILAYIKSYAAAFDLYPHIAFETYVEQVGPIDAGRTWQVRLDNGYTKIYKGVVVANGRTWYPKLPDYQGRFAGEAYHSFSYTSPEVFKGKRALIVGGGNSGCDIACDAARTADTTFISLRRGYYFIPKYIFGVPADLFAHRGPVLPGWLEQPVFQFLLNKLLVGNLERFGLPQPDHNVLESHPILNTEIIHYLGHGDIVVKPDIEALGPNSVRFEDGTEEEIDLIIYATGYRQIFPFMADQVLDAQNGLPDLYLNIFHRSYDNLFFVGLFETDTAAYPILSKQTNLVAHFIRAQQQNPERFAELQALKKVEYPHINAGRNYLDTSRHTFYLRGKVYVKYLEKVCRILT
jgi:cation diffusion facilitator CzcD-associated flavoprotein CzcO